MLSLDVSLRHPSMLPLSLDLLPRPFQSVVQSAGYRTARWAAARQVLGNRIARQRIHGLLGQTLGRWGVAHAAGVGAEGFQLTFGLLNDRLWLCDGLAGEALERALLHLPALRDFWRQELRHAHFEALKAVVPKAWVREETPVPPGAVIHGLGITSWSEVSRLNGREPAVVAEGPFFMEKPPVQTRINATYHRDDKRHVLLRSVEALS